MKIGAMNHPAHNPLEEIDPSAVRAALDRHGLGVMAHTAWFIPLGSPFTSVREASLVEFRRALRAAHQLGNEWTTGCWTGDSSCRAGRREAGSSFWSRGVTDRRKW
jgi:sugar phosphate isomerase/epimerase